MRGFLSSLNPRLPRTVQLLQVGGLMNAFGNGLVVPFLLIYLHNERGIGLGVAGLVLATNAAVSLIAGPIGGALVDRVGGKAMLTAALGFLTAGFIGYAFVESPWQGFLASAVTGIGNGLFWPAQSTLLAGLTTRAQRSATFAMQRVVMNLGIGLGGVAGGFIASESFRALFVLDALTFVAYAVVLTIFVHDPARSEVRAERTASRDSASYRMVFRHRVFMALMVANSLYIGAGIAQLEILPAFAKNEAGVSERGIGWLFFINTIVIVFLQLPTTRLAEGRRRVPLLAVLGAVSAAAWLLVPLSSLWLTGAAAFALLAVAVSVFALGECLHGAVQPTLVVDLADPRLIGRYMAISALSWQVGFMVGPAVGGVLLAASPTGLWLVMASVLLLGGLASLALERFLPAGLRRVPPGARPQEPVALPVPATEPETAQAAG
ncbi:MAG TPA: MFS transporter [Gaiellaceae bacterium]|nr:MFS transporter [Gaiellaceae bacterium]